MKTKIKGDEYWYTFERKIIYFMDQDIVEGDEIHLNTKFVFKLDDPSPQMQEACEMVISQMEKCAVITKGKD